MERVVLADRLVGEAVHLGEVEHAGTKPTEHRPAAFRTEVERQKLFHGRGNEHMPGRAACPSTFGQHAGISHCGTRESRRVMPRTGEHSRTTLQPGKATRFAIRNGSRAVPGHCRPGRGRLYGGPAAAGHADYDGIIQAADDAE